MVVLTILGLLIAAAIGWLIITKINQYTTKKFNYQIFDGGTLVLVTIAYALIYFGFDFYQSALKNGGDILNGQLMIAIGVILIVLDIWINIKNTNFEEGVVLSIIQLLFYVVGAAAIAFLVVIAIGIAGGGRNGYYCDDDCY